MKSTRKLIIFIFTLLALAASAYAQSPREELQQMVEQLQKSPNDNALREKIIKLAASVKPAPAIPEEVRKHFVEGKAIVNAAKNPAQQALAAQHFIESLKIAPWWGDAYYNLALTQEFAGQLDNAEQSLKWFLLSNPSESEAREAKERIYAIVKKQKRVAEKEYRERKAAELCPARCDATKEMHR